MIAWRAVGAFDALGDRAADVWAGRYFRRAALVSLVFLALAVSGWSAWSIARNGISPNAAAVTTDESELDQRMQQAATFALGSRRGTVIVMDPQTGRVRAIVNSELAVQESFPPGSTIKPFTALAALRAGLIDEDSRTLCHEKYFRGEFHTTCSHPRDLPPLNPTEAIAYSCNYYFGKLGERLSEESFSATLSDFGFARKTGVNTAGESTGKMQRAVWRPQSAMGEGEYLQTTPLQLINAYTALVNGGHVLVPHLPATSKVRPEIQSNIAIDSAQRELIVKGMRGAIRYGTAESANLYSLPLYIFGKTGTATEINGYRTHGWFVGFAARANNDGNDGGVPPPDKVELAVLVFLARAHGVEAAEVARPIFAEFGKTDPPAVSAAAESQAPVLVPANSANDSLSPSTVRVYVARENAVRTMSVEDYVRGVVAAEGSTEEEPEALKALAVASRTYIRKNLGRHSADGYDFCTTTHCQRYVADGVANVPARVKEAVEETSGEVLRDTDNQIVDSYFSASCGGATANLTTLWGKRAPAYLQGVNDEYCESQPHHSWTDRIPEAKLLQALQSDPRTNIGARLADVSVTRRDDSERAQLITIQGERRLIVSGWDFKIIVGRALGWNLLKSSRFEISRSGSDFVFHGSGFGHGLGLCQEGAHVMAARGASYRQILRKYFPTTHLASEHPAAADLLWGSRAIDPISTDSQRTTRLTIASEGFRLNYPSTVRTREAEDLLTWVQSARRQLIDRVKAAGFSLQFPALEIFINNTTGNFVGRTGQPPWAAAATRNQRIELQPLPLLKRKRILETTLRHELAHAAIDALGGGRTPHWLAEGLAIYLAGEGKFVERYAPRSPMKPEEIEQKLAGARSSQEMRVAYAAAYLEVKRLIESEGEAKIWRRVAQ
ncbi:MAG: stage sporulation protein [Pyrinomonadaceae bacterium]|jgi:stage II sporulation protein D|nr:stage sporulation protein [Pyrinomonadaceae bacterium]